MATNAPSDRRAVAKAETSANQEGPNVGPRQAAVGRRNGKRCNSRVIETLPIPTISRYDECTARRPALALC